MHNCKQDCAFTQREGDKDLSGKGRGRMIVRWVGEWVHVCVWTHVYMKGEREREGGGGEREEEQSTLA